MLCLIGVGRLPWQRALRLPQRLSSAHIPAMDDMETASDAQVSPLRNITSTLIQFSLIVIPSVWLGCRWTQLGLPSHKEQPAGREEEQVERAAVNAALSGRWRHLLTTAVTASCQPFLSAPL